LAELVAIVKINRAFYEDFIAYLHSNGYSGPQDFVNETNDARGIDVISGFLARTSEAELLNGVGNPYPNHQARWYFLAWILRDAPAQRASNFGGNPRST
jgi:hypothetical protein